MFTMYALMLVLFAVSLFINLVRMHSTLKAWVVFLRDNVCFTVKQSKVAQMLFEFLPTKPVVTNAMLLCEWHNPSMHLVYKINTSKLVHTMWLHLLQSVVDDTGCGDLIFESKTTLYTEYQHPKGNQKFVKAITGSDKISLDAPQHSMNFVDKVFAIDGDNTGQDILCTLNMFAGPNYDFHHTSCTVKDLLMYCRLTGKINKTDTHFFSYCMRVTTRKGKHLQLDKDTPLRDICKSSHEKQERAAG